MTRLDDREMFYALMEQALEVKGVEWLNAWVARNQEEHYEEDISWDEQMGMIEQCDKHYDRPDGACSMFTRVNYSAMTEILRNDMKGH